MDWQVTHKLIFSCKDTEILCEDWESSWRVIIPKFGFFTVILLSGVL